MSASRRRTRAAAASAVGVAGVAWLWIDHAFFLGLVLDGLELAAPAFPGIPRPPAWAWGIFGLASLVSLTVIALDWIVRKVKSA